MSAYHTSSPVLFLIFNRPDTTQLVFDQIRNTQPSRLYIAADGPRDSRPDDKILCAQARSVIENIDWPCEVKTLFREENLGCKYAVSESLDWFFKQEEEGIILEDDCLPSEDFFRLCDVLLEKYRYDTRIFQIAGCNFQQGRKWGDASYYFSNLLEVWGWASWRRVWQLYDPDLLQFDERDITTSLDILFNEPLVTKEYADIFKRLKANEIDTWDYQLKFINFFNNGLCAIPNDNLVSNIGFREDATHTVDLDGRVANLPHGKLEKALLHPHVILPSKMADLAILDVEFSIEKKKQKEKRLSRRIRRWLFKR